MSPVIDERPTLEERYSKAVLTSNLKVEERRRGDADMLIASGWVGDHIGPMLYRLLAEFDHVRCQIHGQGPMNRTESLLVLSHLKSLRETKDALGRFACVQATRDAFMQPDAVVNRIAGRVLDAFIDPTCHSCDGRGFNGGTHRGERQIICRACSGTGKRRTSVGVDNEERKFSRSLLCAMERALESAEREMGRFLRNPDQPA